MKKVIISAFLAFAVFLFSPMRRFTSLSTARLAPLLMDGPVVHPKFKDVLLADWNDPKFHANHAIDDVWSPEAGYVRFADLSKGDLKRVYAQFAIQHDRNPPQWMPFIIDTGASATFLSKNTMRRLGVKVDRPDFLDGASFTCGNLHFYAGVSNGNGAADDPLTNVNVLGMVELKDHVRPMFDSLTRAIGRPPVPSVWVKVGDAVMNVTPAENNVFALKEAVKAKLESHGRGTCIDGFKMTVATHDGTACATMSAPLEANMESTAYIVVL
jgi:hypothetical protein